MPRALPAVKTKVRLRVLDFKSRYNPLFSWPLASTASELSSCLFATVEVSHEVVVLKQSSAYSTTRSDAAPWNGRRKAVIVVCFRVAFALSSCCGGLG